MLPRNLASGLDREMPWLCALAVLFLVAPATKNCHSGEERGCSRKCDRLKGGEADRRSLYTAGNRLHWRRGGSPPFRYVCSGISNARRLAPAPFDQGAAASIRQNRILARVGGASIHRNVKLGGNKLLILLGFAPKWLMPS
jgi:hypothetical protein